MDEETTDINDNLPDLEKTVPEDVLMSLVHRRIILLCITIWSLCERN